MKLDAGTDLTKLRVGQLKALLEERGVVCRECVEKGDFVTRLQQLIKS